MKIYAGIGARATPNNILSIMKRAGYCWAQQGWLLRSGGAHGADSAFQEGCEAGGGYQEIYIPRRGFNDQFASIERGIIVPSRTQMDEADYIMRQCGVTPPEKYADLFRRNVFQIIGLDFKSPARFVLFWAPINDRGDPTGGTGASIKIARCYGVPCYNLRRQDILDRVTAVV